MGVGLPNLWVLGGAAEFGMCGDFPELDTLPAVGSSHLDTLPLLDGSFPMFDTLPAVGSSRLDTLPLLDGSLPMFDALTAVGSNHSDI